MHSHNMHQWHSAPSLPPASLWGCLARCALQKTAACAACIICILGVAFPHRLQQVFEAALHAAPGKRQQHAQLKRCA
eukprot:1161346-Pelagomonas_calceolata.AAC.4